jgi:DNA invertase Pin-like site-specific DNA recombinase
MARIIGYARTSTVDQRAGLDAQVRDLRAAGCVEIFQEQVSSVGERAELDRALASLGRGDILAVTKIDRLARSIRGLCEIVDGLEAKGAALRILSMGLDTSTPTGRLMLNVLGSVAQFEREVMLERQREGITKGQADGKYRGRPRARAIDGAAARALVASGRAVPLIAAEAGVSRAAVYRAMARA